MSLIAQGSDDEAQPRDGLASKGTRNVGRAGKKAASFALPAANTPEMVGNGAARAAARLPAVATPGGAGAGRDKRKAFTPLSARSPALDGSSAGGSGGALGRRNRKSAAEAAPGSPLADLMLSLSLSRFAPMLKKMPRSATLQGSSDVCALPLVPRLGMCFHFSFRPTVLFLFSLLRPERKHGCEFLLH